MSGERQTITVGLMADPGLPAEMARKVNRSLPDLLPQRVDSDVDWVVDVVDEALSLNEDGDVDLPNRAPDLLRSHGWDMVLYITDLPRFEDNVPVVAEVAPAQRAAALSLPTLGVLNLKKRVTETLARMVGHLHAGQIATTGAIPTVTSDRDDPDALKELTPLEGTTSGTIREELAEPQAGDTHAEVEQIYSPTALSKLRLLTGMVLSNRPGRLPLAMTKSGAAAAAAGAYGVFYGSIWVLSDVIVLPRQIFVTVLAIALMTAWLIATNGLWTRAKKREGGRRWAAMDNTATVVTVVTAAVMMYATLFLMLFVAALILIPEHYLAGELEHEVSWVDYLDLTWLATSMGIMAGAVGSSFDDDDAIRDATYSLRESERRSQFKQEQKEADEQGNEPPPVDEVDRHGRRLGTAGTADGENAGHLTAPGTSQTSEGRS
ncbi:hypothetical protein [Micrococcus terreus]|uniref:hypothetical protein n=1 Tax=Micrococcus terreus TaxID=574650 RepID=UPI003D757DF3